MGTVHTLKITSPFGMTALCGVVKVGDAVSKRRNLVNCKRCLALVQASRVAVISRRSQASVAQWGGNGCFPGEAAVPSPIIAHDEYIQGVE